MGGAGHFFFFLKNLPHGGTRWEGTKGGPESLMPAIMGTVLQMNWSPGENRVVKIVHL